MLIEFRVKNFRSLRDEQVLSMVASSGKALRDTHVFETGLRAAPGLLKAAAIYGANASGKSTIIRALQVMREVVIGSAARFRPGQALPGQPFRLDAQSVTEPTEFEVTFLRDGVRWQYGFAMTAERIVSEHLLVYKAVKPQRWFERHYDADQKRDVYVFSTGFKGARQAWEAATRQNALFLSTAVQLNSEALQPVFDEFLNHLVIVNERSPLPADTLMTVLHDVEMRQRLCGFMRQMDVPVADIEIVVHNGARSSRHPDAAAGGVTMHRNASAAFELRLRYMTEKGETWFPLAEASRGSRRLLFLGALLLPMLKEGGVLMLDDMETGLHSLLVRELVQLFHSPRTNTGNAQLIFTTHDTSLLGAEDLLRRDQVWFMEKGAEQASSLIGLSEYSPRRNEALERGYLQGRYGAIPMLRQGAMPEMSVERSAGKRQRQMGTLKGRLSIPDDFNRCFEDDIADLFAGRESGDAALLDSAFNHPHSVHGATPPDR